MRLKTSPQGMAQTIHRNPRLLKGYPQARVESSVWDSTRNRGTVVSPSARGVFPVTWTFTTTLWGIPKRAWSLLRYSLEVGVCCWYPQARVESSRNNNLYASDKEISPSARGVFLNKYIYRNGKRGIPKRAWSLPTGMVTNRMGGYPQARVESSSDTPVCASASAVSPSARGVFLRCVAWARRGGGIPKRAVSLPDARCSAKWWAPCPRVAASNPGKSARPIRRCHTRRQDAGARRDERAKPPTGASRAAEYLPAWAAHDDAFAGELFGAGVGGA